LIHNEISITISLSASSFVLSFSNSILFNDNLNYTFINSQIFHKSTRSFKSMISSSKRSFSFHTLRTTVQDAFEKNEFNNDLISFFQESFINLNSFVFFISFSSALSLHAHTSTSFVFDSDQQFMKKIREDFITSTSNIHQNASNNRARALSLSSISIAFNSRSTSSIRSRKRQKEISFTTSTKKIKSMKKTCICTLSMR
jgi:hypothetical protein